MEDKTEHNLPVSPAQQNISSPMQKPDPAAPVKDRGTNFPRTPQTPDIPGSPQTPDRRDISKKPNSRRRATYPTGPASTPNIRALPQYPNLSRWTLKANNNGSHQKPNFLGSAKMPNPLDAQRKPALTGPPHARNPAGLPRQPPRNLPRYTRTRNPTPPGLARKYPSERAHGPVPLATREKEVARLVDELEDAIESLSLKVQWLGTWWLDMPHGKVDIFFPVAGEKLMPMLEGLLGVLENTKLIKLSDDVIELVKIVDEEVGGYVRAAQGEEDMAIHHEVWAIREILAAIDELMELHGIKDFGYKPPPPRPRREYVHPPPVKNPPPRTPPTPWERMDEPVSDWGWN